MPISGFIESFILALPKEISVDDAAEALLEYFKHIDPKLNTLTLQDAVYLVVFAVRTTIETMRFQARLRTVGGPIDVLVIKPDAAQWLSRKQLHVTGSVSLPGPTNNNYLSRNSKFSYPDRESS